MENNDYLKINNENINDFFDKNLLEKIRKYLSYYYVNSNEYDKDELTQICFYKIYVSFRNKLNKNKPVKKCSTYRTNDFLFINNGEHELRMYRKQFNAFVSRCVFFYAMAYCQNKAKNKNVIDYEFDELSNEDLLESKFYNEIVNSGNVNIDNGIDIIYDNNNLKNFIFNVFNSMDDYEKGVIDYLMRGYSENEVKKDIYPNLNVGKILKRIKYKFINNNNLKEFVNKTGDNYDIARAKKNN